MNEIYEESHFVNNYKRFENRLNNLYWQKYRNWYLDFKKFPDETFKQINGYHGFYFISNYGQVISFYKKYTIVRKYNFISGFFTVQLHLFGIIRNHNIHDLTYTTFVGPIKPGRRVIHINGITKNSIRDCLRGRSRTAGKFQWKYKGDSIFEKGIVDIGPVKKINQYNCTPVLEFDRNGKFIREYINIKEAAETLGIKIENIRECFRGRSKTADGFQWRYINEPRFIDGVVDIEPVIYKNQGDLK